MWTASTEVAILQPLHLLVASKREQEVAEWHSREGCRTQWSHGRPLRIFKAIEVLLTFADTLNFVFFIMGSKYPSLVHRIAKINFVGCAV